MKKIILFLGFVLLSGKIFSQTPAAPAAPTGREISGIVKDSTDNPVIGAIVILKSATDSVKLNTNTRGVFVFKNVATGQFTISVRSIGYRNFNKRFLFNDGTSRLVLDPIILKDASTVLNAVVINGTPSITYKEDTVEYRASDYVMKPNASVEDLIKKMEGFEVAADGSVTHQGIAVTRAKLNGKNVGGADLASTIQNLPADIVEKIQAVDDYGDQAARTGIKDGDPERVLNIVTRADRSVGNRLQAEAGAGNNERYNSRLNLNRFNGNEQIFVRGNFNNTVTGVAGNTGGGGGGGFTGGGQGGGTRGSVGGQGGGGTFGGGGQGGGGSTGGGASSSGGINTSGGTTISYSDTWSKKLDFSGSYSFNGRNTNSTINSQSTLNMPAYSSLVYQADSGETGNDSHSHSLNAELRYKIDSANFLQITPSVAFSSSGALNQTLTNYSGGLVQYINNNNNSDNTAPSYGLTVYYDHNFNKKGRVLSFLTSTTLGETDQERTTENGYFNYNPQTGTFYMDTDLSRNRLITNDRRSNNYRTSFTFSEPLSLTSRLEFNAQVNKRDYDNNQITKELVNGSFVVSPKSSKIYNYSFTEERFALNYRYLKGKYNVSLGVTAVPAVLSGFSETLNSDTRRTSLNVIPIARAEYQWSRQKRLNIGYSGSALEPSFDQIQDVPDESNPQNIIYGNPNLKAQFVHRISSGFNNYITNSKLNFSVNAQASKTENKVIANAVVTDLASGKKATFYTNSNGNYSLNGNYNISKGFASRKYQVAISGNVNYTHGLSLSQGLENISQVRTFNQRLGLQLYPTTWFEISPNVRYSILKSEFSLTDKNNSKTNTWSINAEGRVDVKKGFFMTYNLSKSYVNGINANVTSNPFVINTALSKDVFKRKGTIQIQAFDILNQNNFVVRSIGDNGYTDTKSNALSRYFMLNFTLRLQKWTGQPNRNGRPMNRRGDGSFLE